MLTIFLKNSEDSSVSGKLLCRNFFHETAEISFRVFLPVIQVTREIFKDTFLAQFGAQLKLSEWRSVGIGSS